MHCLIWIRIRRSLEKGSDLRTKDIYYYAFSFVCVSNGLYIDHKRLAREKKWQHLLYLIIIIIISQTWSKKSEYYLLKTKSARCKDKCIKFFRGKVILVSYTNHNFVLLLYLQTKMPLCDLIIKIVILTIKFD